MSEMPSQGPYDFENEPNDSPESASSEITIPGAESQYSGTSAEELFIPGKTESAGSLEDLVGVELPLAENSPEEEPHEKAETTVQGGSEKTLLPKAIRESKDLSAAMEQGPERKISSVYKEALSPANLLYLKEIYEKAEAHADGNEDLKSEVIDSYLATGFGDGVEVSEGFKSILETAIDTPAEELEGLEQQYKQIESEVEAREKAAAKKAEREAKAANVELFDQDAEEEGAPKEIKDGDPAIKVKRTKKMKFKEDMIALQEDIYHAIERSEAEGEHAVDKREANDQERNDALNIAGNKIALDMIIDYLEKSKTSSRLPNSIRSKSGRFGKRRSQKLFTRIAKEVEKPRDVASKNLAEKGNQLENEYRVLYDKQEKKAISKRQQEKLKAERREAAKKARSEAKSKRAAKRTASKEAPQARPKPAPVKPELSVVAAPIASKLIKLQLGEKGARSQPRKAA